MKRVEEEGRDLVSALTCLAAAAGFLAGFLVLAVRLAEVQISDSAAYGYANARQSVRRVQTDGPRGRILDRNQRVLADNVVVRSVVCLPERFQRRSWDATVQEIMRAIEAVGKAIGCPSTLRERDVRRHVREQLALPLVVWRNADERVVAILSERAEEFPGFEVRDSAERRYPMGTLAAHLLGYVGRDRGESVAGDEKFHFFEPEMRGKAGVEVYYDSFLRGVPGENKVLVDARGFATREWTAVEPRRGLDLRLTIDARIQAAAEAELSGLKGACVVLNPVTGDVLALASAPGYDPNEFVPVLRSELYSGLVKDPDKPLLNRACGGAYAPGSTFKPVMALAGLSAGCLPDRIHDCTGVFELGAMRLHCASRWGHGPLDLQHALMKSCNPYFCSLALEVGTNVLVRTAKSFGLGSKTGIDFGVDMGGTVPDATWKMNMYHERWFTADLVQMSIGQGMLLVSPLQMARVAGAIGTGSLVTPRLKADLPVERRALPFPKKHLDVVRQGMRMVVEGDGHDRGTGWRAGENVPVPVCGKTGTAEVGVGERRRKNVWFIAYAPAEDPKISLAIVIENGESGGRTAAPKAAAILRAAFSPSDPQPWNSNRLP